MSASVDEATPAIAAPTGGVRPRQGQGLAMRTLLTHAPRISGGSSQRTTGQAAAA